MHQALGLTDDEAADIETHPRPCAQPPRAGHVCGDVVRALLLQVVSPPPAPAADARRPGCWSARARTPAWSTSATGSPRPSASRATTTRRPSSPTRARPPGVGGILRDIFTMGARPIALMDPLRFGPLDDARSRWIAEGVVSGISGYGNAVGVPTVGGEVVFDETYAGQPAGERAVPRAAPGRPARARPGARRGQPGRAAGLDHRARRHRRRERAGVGRVRRRRRGQAAQRPGRRSLRGEAAHRGVPGAARRRAWWSASRTSAAPGSPAPPARRRRAAGMGMDVDVAAVPRREPGMEPFEVMTSREPGAHAGHRRARGARRGAAALRALGGAGHRRRAGDRGRAPAHPRRLRRGGAGRRAGLVAPRRRAALRPALAAQGPEPRDRSVVRRAARPRGRPARACSSTPAGCGASTTTSCSSTPSRARAATPPCCG